MIVQRMIALLVALSLHMIILALAIDSDLLSWEPHIALIENFLSAKECDDIIYHAKLSNQYKPEQVDVDASVYFDHYPRLPSWLQAIERRIGAVTGQAPHPDEEPINIHQIRQHKDRIAEAVEAQDCIVNKPKSDAKTCRLSVGGTHHDKVQKEFSSVTMIVYLNDVAEGGGTVWPCMSVYANGTQPKASCSAAFQKGARWFDGDKAVILGQYSKRRVSPDIHEPLQQVLLASHYGCLDESKQPAWIKTNAVRTSARKGSAVVFFHDRPDRQAQVDAWHAGCLPLTGEKWTLQKFKELPTIYRGETKSNEL